jgi:Fe-S cluster assembly ATP-binding protein
MYEKNKGSILIITHQERILDIADTVIVLSEGTVSAQGTKEEILPGLFGTQKPCRVIVGGEA